MWEHTQADAALAAFQNFQSPDENRYQYQALREGEIRLIKISFPTANGAKHAMPRLELEHVSLDSAHKYEAISYCWGDQKQSRYKAPIKNGSAWISITKSLAELLAYLPKHCLRSSDTSSYVWIDQLCIDQSPSTNTVEKTQQIALMGEIYSQAVQVLIWLGPGPSVVVAKRIGTIFQPSPTEEFARVMIDLWTESMPADDMFAVRHVWENA